MIYYIARESGVEKTYFDIGDAFAISIPDQIFECHGKLNVVEEACELNVQDFEEIMDELLSNAVTSDATFTFKLKNDDEDEYIISQCSFDEIGVVRATIARSMYLGKYVVNGKRFYPSYAIYDPTLITEIIYKK